MKGHEAGIPSTVFPDDHHLAILGHELGNVLNGLLGMAELLGNSSLTAEQGRWLKAIEDSGRQMEALIRSGWLFKNNNQSPNAFRCERVDGVEMLEQLVMGHTPAARLGKNQLFLVVLAELPRYWFIGACPVRQLLDNLVGNAIKFTRSGEIVIEVSPVLSNVNPEGSIRFRIIDTGPGFDAVAAGQIFTAYSRCKNSGEGVIGNRGLGLYICRRIVLAMGGQISCSSPANGGACFEVTLPGVLSTVETDSSKLPSTLLGTIRCQLRLEGSLRRCVANLLARLGVRCGDQDLEPPGRELKLLISEAPRQLTKDSPSLLLAPGTNSGAAPINRILEAPLLESSLGALLLEIILEWRSLVFRNGNPDSAPRLR